jgi:uncharacterized protein (TIGR02001 family)
MNKTCRILPLALASLTLLGTAAAHADTTPEHTLTGNLSLTSDYRFRGISQTWKQPAVQGGFDYAHASGLYLGSWASNVSGNSYNNGAGLELDLYGGWKLALAPDLVLDLGALAYLYPGARLNSAPGVATDQKYTNVDVYAGLSWGAFSAKLSVATSDYFGLDAAAAGYAYFSALPARGRSKGSAYLDLGYSADLGSGFTLGAHLGRLDVRRYDELSYWDYKLSLAKELGGLNWSVALVGSNADRAYYQAGNSAGQNAKRLGNTGVVLSVGKSF